jgi:hypothetical protein
MIAPPFAGTPAHAEVNRAVYAPPKRLYCCDVDFLDLAQMVQVVPGQSFDNDLERHLPLLGCVRLFDKSARNAIEQR